MTFSLWAGSFAAGRSQTADGHISALSASASSRISLLYVGRCTVRLILLSDRSFVAACRPENTSIAIACKPGVPAR